MQRVLTRLIDPCCRLCTIFGSMSLREMLLICLAVYNMYITDGRTGPHQATAQSCRACCPSSAAEAGHERIAVLVPALISRIRLAIKRHPADSNATDLLEGLQCLTKLYQRKHWYLQHSIPSQHSPPIDTLSLHQLIEQSRKQPALLPAPRGTNCCCSSSLSSSTAS